MSTPLTLQEVAQQQALAEGYVYGPTPTVNNANLNTQAEIGNPLVPVSEPTPYFPPTTITPNLGLTLIGLDDTAAQNMVLIDAATSPNINTQIANYQAVLSDANNVVVMNVSSANNFTIPANATVAFPVGTTLTIIQEGTGQITLVAAAGVTINTPSSLTTRAQYSTIALIQISANTWVAGGDLT